MGNNEILEKAKRWQVGDEATQKDGTVIYVHALNAAGKPLWRKKKDGGAKATQQTASASAPSSASSTKAPAAQPAPSKKKASKVDVPYENLKTINETIAYAKTLSDFTFKREKSDYISDGGKKFSITNKNGLKMTVDFVNDSEYVYNFKDKYGNILYHNSSTNYNSRTNWKDLFNPKTWSSERISALESNISKYEKASRSAKMRYDRSGKSSDYQTYVNNDIWAKNLIAVLKGVKKIAELS